jgi:EAL domain-containing protein (putative c-di-GMP-specific phosphodiesterase class I)/GGDEF domain-containing protein
MSQNAQPLPHILIVDDSDDDFALLARHIRKRWTQARVTHSPSRDELTRLMTTDSFDLVLCDHSMPDMDSTQARDIIRRLGCDAPVIICSGWADEQVGIAAMNDGARDFIEKGRPERLIPVMERELSTRKLLMEKEMLAQQAIAAGRVDPLTQLPNRAHFEELLQDLCTGDAGLTTVVTLTLGGLQRQLKMMRPGFEQNTLLAFAAELQKMFPEHVLGRIAEFEFAVCLQESRGHWGLARCIEEIYQQFDAPLSVRGQRINLDLQLGCADSLLCGPDPKELLSHAGNAMRLAAKNNLHADVLADPAFHVRARRHQTIEHSLASAISDDELQLVYQPVISLPSRQLTSVECLVRWQHPLLGRLSPDEFIGIAEESGLIVQLGEWVLRRACEALKTFHAAGYPITVAINCASPEMAQPGFAQRLLAFLSAQQIDNRFFELEITESAALTDFDATVKILETLHGAGISLAIDDFGTGFSSLNYLRKLPADVLKIDKSFVQEMNEHEDSSKIIRAIIGLGTSLGMTIHAEGIETVAQIKQLEAWGCHRLQGYWISKPLEINDFLDWLKQDGERFLPDAQRTPDARQVAV